MAKTEKAEKAKKKLSANGKKVLVLCCMVALLVVTGVLNYVLNARLPKDDQDVINNGENTVETFFNSYRSNRETARAEEFNYLDAILNSESVSEEVKASAQEKQVELLSFIENELVLESLIKAKGYDDAVVTMSTNNLNVIINKAELTSEEVSKILGVIMEETEYTASQVYIVPYSA